MNSFKSGLILLLLTLCFLQFISSQHGSGNGNGDGSGSGNGDGNGDKDNNTAEDNEESFNANYTLCDPNNRPEICTMIFQGVCGFIQDCKGGNCTKTYGTGCQACGDPDVYAWMNGTCEDIQSVCVPDAERLCTLEYRGVCGVKLDCEGSDCLGTDGTDCTACGNGFNYSLPTECPPQNNSDDGDNGGDHEEEEEQGTGLNQNYTLCDPNNRPEACIQIFEGVCAFIQDCEGGECTHTYGTGCQACSDPKVYAWMDGTCEDIQSVCVPGVERLCTLDYRGVCGVKSDCKGEDCLGTDGNDCTACNNGFNYSLPTECPPQNEEEQETGLNQNYTLCDPNNRPETCIEIFQGVCAFIQDCEGGECTHTYGTGCQACSDPKVYAWMNGTCEDIQSVCVPDVQILCTLEYTGVCGVKSDCKGDDCLGTDGNDCTACNNGFDYSLPTECPPQNKSDGGNNGGDHEEEEEEEEQGTGLNQNYTLCNHSIGVVPCPMPYIPPGACGFIEGCKGGNCTKNYITGCFACNDPDVYAWMNGFCDDIQSVCVPDVQILCTLDYKGVCGVKSDCEGDDCLGTDGNDCTACNNGFSYSLPTECPPQP